MPFALLVITLFFTTVSAWAVQSFSGYIIQNGSQRSLKTQTQVYSLTTENTEVRAQLLKLSSNDFISGIGQPIGTSLIRLETIDFVGLNNFLGMWLSPMGIIRVQDFSSLSLYVPTQSTSVKPAASLNYSITPADGKSWGMFLTDAEKIYFSNLTVAESRASIRFFDTKTGAFQSEVTLSKIAK